MMFGYDAGELDGQPVTSLFVVVPETSGGVWSVLMEMAAGSCSQLRKLKYKMLPAKKKADRVRITQNTFSNECPANLES